MPKKSDGGEAKSYIWEHNLNQISHSDSSDIEGCVISCHMFRRKRESKIKTITNQNKKMRNWNLKIEIQKEELIGNIFFKILMCIKN